MGSEKRLGILPGHLFCSEDGSLQVVDIPLSITYAQNINPNEEPVEYLYSSAALETPYPSIEPKSEKAKANVLARINLETQKRNQEYVAFIGGGLNEIKNLYTGPWNAPRRERASTSTTARLKRKMSSDFFLPLPQLKRWHGASFHHCSLSGHPATIRLSVNTLKKAFVYNDDVLKHQITSFEDGEQETTFCMPPLSAVCICSIDRDSVFGFEINLKQLPPHSQITPRNGQFDIILMDPPWSNRSVSRSDQYSTINARRHEEDPLSAIEEVLPRILAANALLAIWVTNKSSSRQRALNLFESLGINDVEEWVWIKVTTSGEPVYNLDGLYRQPWEVCLVGRYGVVSSDALQNNSRRLIAACPDLHSRKPAIGSMLVDHYNAPQPYHLGKLEIFARCASAGWWAWGNEAIKFNDRRCWTDTVDSAIEASPDKDSANTKDLH